MELSEYHAKYQQKSIDKHIRFEETDWHVWRPTMRKFECATSTFELWEAKSRLLFRRSTVCSRFYLEDMTFYVETTPLVQTFFSVGSLYFYYYFFTHCLLSTSDNTLTWSENVASGCFTIKWINIGIFTKGV